MQTITHVAPVSFVAVLSLLSQKRAGLWWQHSPCTGRIRNRSGLPRRSLKARRRPYGENSEAWRVNGREDHIQGGSAYPDLRT